MGTKRRTLVLIIIIVLVVAIVIGLFISYRVYNKQRLLSTLGLSGLNVSDITKVEVERGYLSVGYTRVTICANNAREVVDSSIPDDFSKYYGRGFGQIFSDIAQNNGFELEDAQLYQRIIGYRIGLFTATSTTMFIIDLYPATGHDSVIIYVSVPQKIYIT